MIQLTKLNGEVFTLNATMIEQIQSFPDTTITLINSKKIVVTESELHVSELITSFYKKIGIHVKTREVGENDEEWHR